MGQSPDPERAVTSRVALDPADWDFATWRPRTPTPRPAPPAFQRDEALARLRRLLVLQPGYGGLDWSRANLAATLSPEEGHFWLHAMTDPARDARQSQVVRELQHLPLTGRLTREQLRSRLRQRADFLPPLVVVPLAGLLPPPELIDLLTDGELYAIDAYHVTPYAIACLQAAALEGFRRYVRPYLDGPALHRLREVLRARVPSSLWTQAAAPPLEQVVGYRLAPLLGLHRETAALVSSWPDGLFLSRGGNGFEEWRRWPQEVVFGLGDAWQVEQQARRLNLRMRTDLHGRAWLAHTEATALDVLASSVREASGFVASRLLDVLCLVQSPAAVRPLLELRLEGYTSPALERWFDCQVGNSVAGLLPIAAGRGKLGDAARRYLRDVKRRGFTCIIEEQLPSLEPPSAARIRNTILDVVEVEYPFLDAQTTPAWLQQAMLNLPKLPRGALPDWLDFDDLPPLVMGGQQLDAIQRNALVRTLAVARYDAPPTLLTGLRTHADLASREAFAWRLVEAWQCAGRNDRECWALHAPGFLGGDESVHKLVAFVRDSKGTSGRRRAHDALDALAAIGSSLALVQLSALARLAPTRPLRDRARLLVDQLAHARGLSRTELEDGAVPTLGFTGEHGPTFDFGPRQFQAILARGPRLLLRDASGSVRTDLPAPNTRDDPERVRHAIADWRLLRRSLREVLKEQSARLERAMVSGQRWSPRHFRERVLGQPLLRQLARLLLWAGYDERRRLAGTFRLTDDHTFVDARERAVHVFDFNSVRIVHPIELPDTTRQTWATVWLDHELIAPFPQLGRRLYPVRDCDRLQTVVTAFRGRRIPALTLAGLVKGRDWQPTAIGNARLGEAHLKEFRLWATTAVLHHPNVGRHVYPYHQAEQELRGAYFFRGRLDPDDPIDLDEAVRLEEIPDLVREEACELMALLYSKGKE